MRRILLPILALALVVQASAAELTMVTYNLLNFPGSTGTQRSPYFRTVIESVGPDFMVCQEVESYNGRDQFLDNVLDVVEPDAWTVGPFHDGFDTDRALFYKSDRLEVLDNGWLDTTLRDIDWWHLRHIDSQQEFRIFTVHLKASQGDDNEQRRLAEVTVLRNFLVTLPSDLPVIVAGDLNIYESAEPAYVLLMAPGTAQLHDPIQQPGVWHNNLAFAAIHTQSTRTASFGGGANGGLDDRFDQILVSDEWLDGEGIEILPDTYAAYGNDGQHFNQAIIDGVNLVVTPEVANALHESSDHLPVRVVLSIPSAPVAVAPTLPPASLAAWPNPFNPTVSLRVEQPGAGPTDLVVYDLGGRAVATLWRGHVPTPGEVVTWQPQALPSGVYIVRLLAGGRALAGEKLLLLK